MSGPAFSQLRKCFAHDEQTAGDDDDAKQLHKRQGGHPRILDLHCTHDYDSFIGESVDTDNVSGFGSFKRLHTERGNSRPTRQESRSTEVSHLQFFVPVGSELAKCRYTTSSQSNTFLPQGADGRSDIGIHIFKEGTILPDLDVKPPLAGFSVPWKNKEEVTEMLTTLHEKKPDYQSLAQQREWTRFLKDAPAESGDIALSEQPLWELRPASELVPSTNEDRVGTRCIFDPPDDPPVPSMTDRDYPPAQKRKDVARQLAGAYNCM
jgi:hypothetical protein